jgi:polyphosphate kinase 2 (PPK2 family)
MLEDILSYMHSLDEKGIINRVFLVKKTVSESFFASVFVVHFYGGTDEERRDIMHGIFRYLDSYPVEKQFALFDYFEYPDVKIEKIEGSLVYEKNKNP